MGLPPAEAPAVFSLLQAIELEEQGDDGAPLGVYYPTGGFGTFRDALLAACEAAGVEVRFGTRVAAVEVEEGQVVGVRLAKASGSATAGEAGGGGGGEGGGGEGGELLGAGCVVVNADVAAAEGALLAPHLRRSRYDELSEVGGGDGPLETDEARAAAVAGAATAGEGVGVGGVLAAAASAARGEDRPWRYSTSSVKFRFYISLYLPVSPYISLHLPIGDLPLLPRQALRAAAAPQRLPRATRLQPYLASLQPNLASLQPYLASLQPYLASLQPYLDNLQPQASRLWPRAARLQPDVASLQPDISPLPSRAPRYNVPLEVAGARLAAPYFHIYISQRRGAASLTPRASAGGAPRAAAARRAAAPRAAALLRARRSTFTWPRRRAPTPAWSSGRATTR